MGPDQNPFFVVGSARSGTTMLRLMLNAHPEVAVPPESRFITELYREDPLEASEFLQQLTGHKRFREWDLPIEAVAQELPAGDRLLFPDAISAAFRAYARSQGKTRWGDKTPRYIEHIELLSDLFPGARFIHLVRDGRNVALSYAHVPFGPKTVGAAAALWKRRVEAGIRAGRPLGPERYMEIRYEKLVETTETTMREVSRFIEVDFDDAMLDYTKRAKGAVLPRASRYNPHVTEPPQKRVRSWEDDMRAGHVEVFESVAGDTLVALDYPLRFERSGWKARTIGFLGQKGLPVGRIS